MPESPARLGGDTIPVGSNVMEATMLSARNQFEGVVKSVKLGEVMAEVVVSLAGGLEVVSAITRGSAESMGLRVGDRVKAVVKSTEVLIDKP